MKKYALISVSDKTGIETVAMELEKLGYTILSTSNTFRHLSQFCSEIVEIASLTGFPEILDGRVKTLHPIIHAGILADRDEEKHVNTLKEMGISPIDVVIVNLYPFEKVRADSKSTHAQIIENIDIGGPTLIRAAAKNYRHVCVLTDPKDYSPCMALLKNEGKVPEEWSSYLAHKAFLMVSTYDGGIADYLDKLETNRARNIAIPDHFDLSCMHTLSLRYGENPHQQAGFYTCTKKAGWSMLHGKELSFNNLMDIDAGFRAIRLFTEPTVIILKHCNPCGIGSGFTLSDAYRNAFATDTVSPFGGIVIVNRSLDLETAIHINKIFTEIIIAPGYQDGVLEVLQKKKDRRLIEYKPGWLEKPVNSVELKTMTWGYLLQQWDLVNEDISTWRVVSRRQPSPYEFDAMVFGWKTVAILKSNAIALTTDDKTLGLGIGQTSRIDSTAIAIMKAKRFKHDLSVAACASDGFFPFRDSIDELYQHGIKAIIQPGGSKGDDEVIQACNELDIAMVFTGVRHFKH